MAKEKNEEQPVNRSAPPQLKECTPAEYDETYQKAGWIHLNTKTDADGNKKFVIADRR